MERGAGASNLHMRFNLASIKPGTVQLTKELTGVEATESVLAEFPYQIMYTITDKITGAVQETGYVKNLPSNSSPSANTDNYNVVYKDTIAPVKYEETFTIDGVSYNDVFFLKPGETADISFPIRVEDDNTTLSYSIVECGVNTDVYSNVTVKEVADSDVVCTHVDDHPNRANYSIPEATTNDRPIVTYTNTVNPSALRTLTITKKLYDETGEHTEGHEVRGDSASFDLRLFLATEFDSNINDSPASMYTYHVKDATGHYCKWDVNEQKLVPTEWTDYSALDDSQKALVSFDTSINGSIANIPAFFTVEVMNVLAGTQYRVEERPWEIPDGYSFQEYLHDGTAQVTQREDVDGVVDTVVANVDPHVDVCNIKGWGLRVNKVWSDAEYMSEREPTYFAVFIQRHGGNGNGNGDGNVQLVNGTVRQLKFEDDPQTLYWYFDSLESGVGFDKYIIREVRLTGNGWEVSDNGIVTGVNPSNVHSIHNEARLELEGKQKGETGSSTFDYTVLYETGSTSADSNVRVDTVTNNRPGIVLKKQDWYGNPLAGATFALADNNGNLIGTFTSDAEGLISVAFLRDDAEYTLTETGTPQGYHGLEAPITITLSDGSVTVGPDGVNTGYYEMVQGGGTTPTLTIKNRPYTFEVVKKDGDSEEPLAGVHFELHKQVTVDEVTMIDITPMAGYEDLVTDENGVVPNLDNTLPAGTYELWEKQTADGTPLDLPGYQALPNHIRFTVSPTGSIGLDSTIDGVSLATEKESDGTLAYTMTILNYRDVQVAIHKTDNSNHDLTGAKFNLCKYGTSWEAVDGYAEIDMTSVATKTLDELTAGRYRLTETVSPDGYILLTKCVYFNVAQDGTISLTDEAGTGQNANESVSLDTSDGNIITIKNTPGQALPVTGGPGTHVLYAIGALLVLAAGALLFQRSGKTSSRFFRLI